MSDTATEPTALEKIVTPEVVDLEIIGRDIGPAIDKALSLAGKLAANVVDQTGMTVAVDAADKVKGYVATLKALRLNHYDPLYRKAEDARSHFDDRIKTGTAIIKTLLAAVSDFNVKAEREARLKREAAEAEARRIQEEADRKRREAEEAAARAKAAAEDEARRKKEAEEAEKRRLQAEKDAKDRQEREIREQAARETQRKLQEEETARLAHAQKAEDVGNVDKVGTILDSQTPISPTMASPQVAKDSETLRKEQELAQKQADERAELERQAAAEAERKRKESEAEAARLKADADQAAVSAKIAAAAASQAVVVAKDSRTSSVTTWKWDWDSDGTIQGDTRAFLALVRAVADGKAPVEFLGFDPQKATDFRPSAINDTVQRLKDSFFCPGVKAFPQQDTRLKARR